MRRMALMYQRLGETIPHCKIIEKLGERHGVEVVGLPSVTQRQHPLSLGEHPLTEQLNAVGRFFLSSQS